jgi:NAD(P)-dependent dehydrogenase (short-subunit alcohol dehydrogenase family)
MAQSSFEGAVVLVTGGASGMGKSVATRFLEEGSTVFVADINEDALAAATQELRGLAPAVDSVAVDVSSSESCDALVSSVIEQAGRLDVLVNSAGVWAEGPSEAIADAD